jgi:hypothetical protein
MEIKNNKYKYNIKELVDYFNGTLKMPSENIYVKFYQNNFLAILDFEKYSLYIQIGGPPKNLWLKSLKITNCKKQVLVAENMAYQWPGDTNGEILFQYLDVLLKG